MKINEVEAAVGVTKKNIRFYEEEGLITPSREPGNGYRSYSQADVERLRRIKLLRKLDVPLAEIREMLEGQKTLAEGMAQQLERLSTRARIWTKPSASVPYWKRLPETLKNWMWSRRLRALLHGRNRE